MPYREIPFLQNNYFHIYNRGNNYAKIFFEEKNYSFFLKKLFEIFDKRISIVAYCLMPNHYHLLIEIIEDNYLEKAMQRFSTSYTKAINKQYGRAGHLFQGRYKTKLIPNNEYLLHLSRYIHLNPVKAGLVRKPEDWKYSSYGNYINMKKSEFLDTGIILNQIEDYAEFVNSYQEEQNYFIKDMLFK